MSENPSLIRFDEQKYIHIDPPGLQMTQQNRGNPDKLRIFSPDPNFNMELRFTINPKFEISPGSIFLLK
jgi:hypothetical protein